RALAVEDPERLLGEQLGVPVQDVVRKDLPLLRTPGRVPDPRRIVADDQDRDMTGVLKGAQAAEDNREAEVDVRARRVDPELRAQRAAKRELPLELPFGKDVNGVSGQ